MKIPRNILAKKYFGPEIFWPFIWDAKRAVGKTRSWKVSSWKVWSWKVPSEVGNNRAKLENILWNWKVSLKLESFTAVGKFKIKSNLGYTIKWSKLSNFNSHFPTSARTLQLHLQFYFAFSNIPTTIFQHLVLSN